MMSTFFKVMLIMSALITSRNIQATRIGSIANRTGQELTLELQQQSGTACVVQKLVTIPANQCLQLDSHDDFYKIPEENPTTRSQFHLCFTLTRQEGIRPVICRNDETFTYELFRRLAPSRGDHNGADGAETDDIDLDLLVMNKTHNGSITACYYWEEGDNCIGDLIIQETGTMNLIWRT